MKTPILMRHIKRGQEHWLEGTLEQLGGHATITNPNGNKLYVGSADFLDGQFREGNIKVDGGREAALLALFGEPTA
jgi:hypothetical protein